MRVPLFFERENQFEAANTLNGNMMIQSPWKTFFVEEGQFGSLCNNGVTDQNGVKLANMLIAPT